MNFLTFLASRGFAIFLLSVSIGFLILWNVYPSLYSRLLLIVPAFLFLSISFCTIKRTLARPVVREAGFWGSFVFHIGLLTVIAATSLGPFTRFWATVVLPQGLTVTLEEEEELVSINSTPLWKEIPFIFLRLDSHETYYENKWFPVDYAASLIIGIMEKDGYSQTKETLRINSPIRKNGYQFLYQHGSVAPLFILRGMKDDVIFNKFVPVANLTDQEDTFHIPAAGLTVYARFFPDMYKEGGRYGTRSKKLKNPAFGLKVTKKEDPFRDIWRGVLKKGEGAEFSGMTLEFADLKPVVTIQVSKDPTYYGIYAGWVLIVAGLLLRYSPVLARGKRVENSKGELREEVEI